LPFGGKQVVGTKAPPTPQKVEKGFLHSFDAGFDKKLRIRLAAVVFPPPYGTLACYLKLRNFPHLSTYHAQKNTGNPAGFGFHQGIECLVGFV
jgi:hypothetical protein